MVAEDRRARREGLTALLSRRRASFAGWSVGLAILLGLVATFSVLNREHELDDALIYYRYFRNFLDGHGLVYNPGEFHNGLTSPLYSYLSLLTCAATGAIRTPMWIQAAVLTAGSLALLFALFVRHERAPFAWVGCALLASSRYTYSLFGLETPLFVLLAALCLLLWDLGRLFWLGIACALLILTRGEGGLLVAAMAALHLARRRPLPRARDFVVPALLLLSNLTFNQSYYGEFLPETLMAKIHQGRSGLWGRWPLVRQAGAHLEYFAGSFPLFLACASLAALGVRRLGRRDLNLAILLFLALLTVFYVAFELPHYHWYYAPYYAFGAMYAGVGTAALYEWTGKLRARPALLAARTGVALAALSLVTTLGVSTAANPLGHSMREVDYRRIASWLRARTPTDASVAMIEVGIIGYYSERRIVDILGVVSPGNAAALGSGRFGDWIALHRPDLILVHDPPVPHERAALSGLHPGEYAPHPRFALPGYALLARR